jgi:hypothetical protein
LRTAKLENQIFFLGKKLVPEIVLVSHLYIYIYKEPRWFSHMALKNQNWRFSKINENRPKLGRTP